MVFISDYDVTKLTSFLDKDTSFLTPWSWNPKACETNDIKSIKQCSSFDHESYFSYQIVDCMTKKTAQVNDNQVNYDWCSLFPRTYSQATYLIPHMFFNQAPINFRSYSQAWCSVPLMFFNQVPIYFMIPIVIETIWRRVIPVPMQIPIPLPQIQNSFIRV